LIIFIRETKNQSPMKKILYVLLLLPFAVFSQNKFSAELLWKLGRVSEPQLSPDGKYVLYAVRTYDLSANKGNTDIWRMEISGANATKLVGTPAEESSARWLNQNKIMYMSDESGDSQLWMMNADGSSKKQITKLDGGINEYGFNAQGNMVWFAKDVKIL
jgi:Tol biopolymer transport system component